MGVWSVARDEKKLFAAGRLLWKARAGTDFTMLFEAMEKLDVSLKGVRRVKAIVD
jgi:hypothetical protein